MVLQEAVSARVQSLHSRCQKGSSNIMLPNLLRAPPSDTNLAAGLLQKELGTHQVAR